MKYRLISDSEPISYVTLKNQDGNTRAFALPLNCKYVAMVFKLKNGKIYLSQNGRIVDIKDIKPGGAYVVNNL